MTTLQQHLLAGKRIVLGLSGGVACYKSAHLCRLLTQAGAQVRVVMTEAAAHFIGAATMQALSGQPVFSNAWDTRPSNGMAHIELGRWADAIVIAPCSADLAARLAQGMADDLLSLLCLARPLSANRSDRQCTPLLIAPAMNREMWAHPATQRNFAQLAADGAHVLGVGVGEQACGETGEGRMLEPEELVEDIAQHFAQKILQNHRVLITAGPTFEAIDPVRGITNLSSGKMGFAIARAAAAAGAAVDLIAGPVHLPTPRGVRRVNVQSALQMFNAVQDNVNTADIFIATAAVADWTIQNPQTQKIKKTAENKTPPTLHLTENPDILAHIAAHERARSGALYCVGFAAETENLLENAQAKRLRKGVPLLAANLGPATFGRDDNALMLIDAAGVQHLPHASKELLAWQLIQAIAHKINA